ncbi:MAG: hypothetical protein ACK4SY_08955 [Pyrobaculum sp.]
MGSFEEVREALRRLVREDWEFLRGVIMEALKGGRLFELALADPELRAGLEEVVARVAREEVAKLRGELERRLGVLEDDVQSLTVRMENVRKFMDNMEDRWGIILRALEDVAYTTADEAREVVGWELCQRGVECRPEKSWLGCGFEFDIYCTTGELTIVGDATTRAGASHVEKVAAKVGEARRRWPEKFKGRVVPVLYCILAEPDAVEKARELGVWLVTHRGEKTPMP